MAMNNEPMKGGMPKPGPGIQGGQNGNKPKPVPATGGQTSGTKPGK